MWENACTCMEGLVHKECPWKGGKGSPGINFTFTICQCFQEPKMWFVKRVRGGSFYGDSSISGSSGIQEPQWVLSLNSTVTSLGNLGLVQDPPEILGLLKLSSSTKRTVAEVTANTDKWQWVCCSNVCLRPSKAVTVLAKVYWTCAAALTRFYISHAHTHGMCGTPSFG